MLHATTFTYSSHKFNEVKTLKIITKIVPTAGDKCNRPMLYMASALE